MIFNLFRDSRQEDQLKAVQERLPDSVIEETTKLHLGRVNITYDIAQTRKFKACISYYERPIEWSNRGMTKEVELVGDSWSDLIDKVVNHFDMGSGTEAKR